MSYFGALDLAWNTTCLIVLLSVNKMFAFDVQDLATVDTILLNKLPEVADRASVSAATFS